MKNKTIKIIKILSAILLVVMLQAMGYTYAKYITSETGTGQAEIAKWGFQIVKNGSETKNVSLVNTVNNDTLVAGKIAPGTSGAILIAVDATPSEVDVDYTIQFANEKNKPNNIVFTHNGTEYSSLSEIVVNGEFDYETVNKKREHAVLWRWAYETGTTNKEKTTNDELDTQDANTITQYTFDIIATGTQGQ